MVKTELCRCFNGGFYRIKVLTERIVEYYLRHASLVQPLSEQGKLKLVKSIPSFLIYHCFYKAQDLTQFEFAINQLITAFGMKMENDLPVWYKALKSFK